MWFGWATAAELQPNIDGLSFDEVMLFATVSGIVVVLATWYLTRRSRVGTDGP
jgi:branched-subunit amino acid ABC-type transport system permease component